MPVLPETLSQAEYAGSIPVIGSNGYAAERQPSACPMITVAASVTDFDTHLSSCRCFTATTSRDLNGKRVPTSPTAVPAQLFRGIASLLVLLRLIRYPSPRIQESP